MWKYILAFAILYLLLLIILPKRYIFALLTYPFLYPDNEKESLLVEDLMRTRTYQDEVLFKLTDPSVVHAFKKHVDESEEELDYIMARPSITGITLYLKYSINRARPYQVNKNIKPLDSKTANTPAYPAGHALQAYFLANILGKKYPEKKVLFDKIAKDCDNVRVKAGLHYPSDGVFAKRIVDLVYN